jgi:rubrerythrin
MPSFLNPFTGNIPERKMSTPELIRALRLDLAGELEAIATYEAHAEACADEKVAGVLRDISSEEKIHCGEILELIEYLDKEEKNLIEEGKNEAAKNLGTSAVETKKEE